MTNEQQDQAEWVELTNLRTGFEADMLRQELEAAEIPVLVRSDAAGMFGAGYGGGVTGGIRVFVPSPEIERARELLDDIL
jgi:Putative prokaryotic signal transducing protein